MSHDFGQHDEARSAEERRQAKARAVQFRRDVQEVFATPAGRRLLGAFLRDAGGDSSALRGDPALTAHAIGWQDAARWWLEALREHCPEREAQLRAEARREAAQGAPQDPSND